MTDVIVAGLPDGALMQLLDAMMPRIADGNSKVAITALEVRWRTASGLDAHLCPPNTQYSTF